MVGQEGIVTNIVTNQVDLSILGLIAGADLIVKLVLLILLAASVWSWKIIVDKTILLNHVSKQIDKFEKVFWSGQLLDQLYERVRNRVDHPLSAVFVVAMDQWHKQRINKHNSGSLSYLSVGLKDRIIQSMDITKNKEMEKLESNLYFLAVVGSTAPFVGLFGTVWGIMNSFKSIAALKNATIAVVAPGIAEALFATAVGLVAAIPAVVFYNFFANKINNISNKVEDFSNELGSLISQEIDRGMDHGSHEK
jgi:biopolymer transport protein TolQ